MAKLRILITLLSCFMLAPVASAADESFANGFFIMTRQMDFDKTIRSGKCYGTIPYPELSNDDEEITIRVNEEIGDFVEIYAICNKNERDHFSVSFDVPDSGSKDYFSVRWITNKGGKGWRIDSLNFNTETGALLDINDIFNMLSDHMMGEMIKLSKGHLPKNANWDHFLERIEKRDIQFYAINREWYITFNADQFSDELVDVKIPKYFLIDREDYDRS